MLTHAPARKYASLSEFAEHFAISERTARRMIAEGQVRAVRVGRTTIRIPLTEIERVEHARPIGNAGRI